MKAFCEASLDTSEERGRVTRYWSVTLSSGRQVTVEHNGKRVLLWRKNEVADLEQFTNDVQR